MFKKCSLALAAVAVANSLSAQTVMVDSVTTTEVKDADKYRVETNHFKHNWFIGFGLGGNMYFGDHDKQMNFGDRIAPYAEIHVGKWFTPGIGVRLGIAGGRIKGLSGWTDHAQAPGRNEYNSKNYQGFVKDAQLGLNDKGRNAIVGGDIYDLNGSVTERIGYPMYETQMDYLNAHADVMFNLSQMIYGYNQERFYSFIPYASVGFAHTLQKAPLSGRYSHEVTAGIGLLNRFRLNDRLDLNLDIRGTYTGEHFDQEDISYRDNNVSNQGEQYGEGILSASVGLTYNLGKRHWDRSTITTIRVNENVLADLRNRVGALQATNDDLRAQLERALNREVTRENVAAQPLLVTFPIDRWVLSNKDRVNLGFLAEVIKANPNMVYSVTGFADRGTGSSKRNVFLARKRSEVIYDCLVKEFGVSESQLKRDSKGGVANMYYNDPRCSRAVLLKVAE